MKKGEGEETKAAKQKQTKSTIPGGQNKTNKSEGAGTATEGRKNYAKRGEKEAKQQPPPKAEREEERRRGGVGGSD